MGERIYINNDWEFGEVFDVDMLDAGYDSCDLKKVRIPHTCKEIPFNYFDEHLYQMLSGYRRVINALSEWEGKRILLTFEAVAHSCTVYLNGVKIGEHHCGYTAFTIDISETLCYGEDNILVVKVDSRENLNIPPFGYVIDYMTYGGIYRDVYIEVKDKEYIEDIFVHSEIDTSVILISNIRLNRKMPKYKLRQYIKSKDNEEYTLLQERYIVDDIDEIEIAIDVTKHVELWDIDSPYLYDIKTELITDGKITDESVVRFGFRKAEFKKDGFYLNNNKIKIRGLNRHQSFPYVGYAMPKSMQYMDAEVLKNELGLNAVRTSHYPQSHYFLEKCDELGLLVFTEIPGWQHIGNEEWKKQAVDNVKEMVIQYRNHPSIILWGVRINESGDDDEFYVRTNEAARQLDPYRPTGGVRAHKKSSLLEDVYTYNDFSHDGKNAGCEPKKKVTSNDDKPYLISEYNGHMYPTKVFDWEEHRVEHAIRHANVLDAVCGEEDIAGCFGWCMADYNTHKDFGSGDRICYHGVLDMFRNPKLAADIYSCQQEKDVILSLSSTMDIGEHPGCNRGKTWIFTNADSVRMYKNDRFIKEYQSSDSGYKNLKHGPIEIDDFIGDALAENEGFTASQAKQIKMALNYVARYGLSKLPWKIIFIALKMMVMYRMKPIQAVELYNKYIGDWGGTSTVYRFEAIKDGKVVKTVVKEPMTNIKLDINVSNTKLKEENSYDVAAVRLQTLDENGNKLHFYNEPLVLRTEGDIELIGESVISLKGGMGGAYVRTIGKSGKGTLIIQSAHANEERVEFLIN